MYESGYWFAFATAIVMIAVWLFFRLVQASTKDELETEHFYELCLSGTSSATAQAIFIWFIRMVDPILAITLAALTVLAYIAGELVFWRLRRNQISSSTAAHLLLLGHIVYPAFLAVFMLWSWDTV